MRLMLKNGDCNTLNFSNYQEGFDIRIYNEHIEDKICITHLTFRPWNDLVPFVTAVVDYSCSNGLSDVYLDDLMTMKNSINNALECINEELSNRRKRL